MVPSSSLQPLNTNNNHNNDDKNKNKALVGNPKDAIHGSSNDDDDDDEATTRITNTARAQQQSQSQQSSSQQQQQQQQNVSAEAAGVVRGATRSLGRSLAKAPIGSLPHRAVFRQRLPVRQVAKLSDRLSTGYEWWTLATNTTNTTNTTTANAATEGRRTWWIQQEQIPRIKHFTIHLFKNTLLGAVVFESYGWIVDKYAPPVVTEGTTTTTTSSTTGQRILPTVVDSHDDNNNDNNHNDDQESRGLFHDDEPDAYARASIALHTGAGWISGSIHGVASTVFNLEGHYPQNTASTSSSSSSSVRLTTTVTLKSLPPHVLHHASSHALLFGSYEGLKRLLVTQMHNMDTATQYYGGGYLVSFAMAGGLAGQIQHISSHYIEQWLKITSPPPTPTSPSSFTSSTNTLLNRLLTTAPALRPTMFAFVPSAIGFVAFEYGKKFST